MANAKDKTPLAVKIGSRATKLTLGFAVVAGRSTKRFATGVAQGAKQAAAEYRESHRQDETSSS
jgi:hypothetical protein